MKCRIIGSGYWAGCYSDGVLDLCLRGAQFKLYAGFLSVVNEVFTIFLQSLDANVSMVP